MAPENITPGGYKFALLVYGELTSMGTPCETKSFIFRMMGIDQRVALVLFSSS